MCSYSTDPLQITLFPSLLELWSLFRMHITSAENLGEGSLPHFVYISFLAQKHVFIPANPTRLNPTI